MLGNLARVLAVSVMCFAAVGSATSSQNNGVGQGPPPPYGGPAAGGAAGVPNGMAGPPAPQAMDPSRALGLWRSTFGAVKIEADQTRGGINAGVLQGVWVYQRRGEEVIGYFSGQLRGNVFEFKWQEPNNPPLTGSGYLVFEETGRQYTGKWWSDARDRQGDWNGWRQGATGNDQPPQQPAPAYGGQQYGTSNPYGPTPPRGLGQPDPYGPQPPAQPQPNPYGPQPQPSPPPRGYY